MSNAFTRTSVNPEELAQLQKELDQALDNDEEIPPVTWRGPQRASTVITGDGKLIDMVHGSMTPQDPDAIQNNPWSMYEEVTQEEREELAEKYSQPSGPRVLVRK